MSGIGSFFANENDKKIAVIKTLLDNHQKLKEFHSAPKKESDSDLVEVIREVYQEKSATIDNSIQQLEDELIILNISNKGSRERIMKLVKQSRENKTDSSTDIDAEEVEKLWEENDNLRSQLENLQDKQNRLEILEGENSWLKESLRKAEAGIERDAKRQERQLSKWEKDHEKNLKEANQRTTEALSQLAENKEKMTGLRKEAAAKEKEIASLQTDRERLEGEITEKNEKIEKLRKRIGELNQNKKENKELEKQIEDLTNQLAEAERLKERAEAEKRRVLEQMKAAQEALNNLNNELEKQREMMNAQTEQLIASWNQIQQKYQTILISLGFSEEEMGEDVAGFLTELLGKKNTGEATTLKDIREISGVKDLQDLIDIAKQWEDEVARLKQIENQQKRKGKITPQRTLSLSVEISEKEIKSLQEEAKNQEEKLEDLSDEELIKRLKTKENEEVIQEKKSLITDILPLLNGPAGKEIGRAAALVILDPISQLKYLEKLKEYQFSDQSKLVTRIIQNFQQQLAQQANQSGITKTPVQESFLVKEIENLKKELEEKESKCRQFEEKNSNLEKRLKKIAHLEEHKEEIETKLTTLFYTKK
ncbi:Conserved protein of unknown function [endosymbiont DhMRE of Dentiscutata heterogama]|uniref:hypothetical protein n=1 Tax=endosymbiont DhMRE of Dentiscutata heterogama TaxID=1609546 RepID=UPI000629D6F0|nr:hypothetical protein [endosymbiont DhMRE of Dentiscutata heterogama]CFW92822.1 Conserved protein of unknown function [endosymbiont DhMRE of Dentiscutata heterogama]